MADDADFLKAIRAAPADPVPRLIYADFLDDHADPRADLIRSQERMRELPPYSDEYWLLKPSRDAIKADAPAEWLRAMSYDLPLAVMGHGWPDGWRERWRVIRAFVTEWHGVAMPDVGGRREEIEAVERAFGNDLPPSLREFVAFSHDARLSGRSELDYHLRLEQHSDHLWLAAPGDYESSAYFEDFDDPDPNVYYDGEGREVASEWVFDGVSTGRMGRAHTLFGRMLVDDFAERLESIGPLRVVGECTVAEGPGFFASGLDLHDEEPRLQLSVAGPLPREAVPEWAWPLLAPPRYNAGYLTGHFREEWDRLAPERPRIAPADSDRDIPF